MYSQSYRRIFLVKKISKITTASNLTKICLSLNTFTDLPSAYNNASANLSLLNKLKVCPNFGVSLIFIIIIIVMMTIQTHTWRQFARASQLEAKSWK